MLLLLISFVVGHKSKLKRGSDQLTVVFLEIGNVYNVYLWIDLHINKSVVINILIVNVVERQFRMLLSFVQGGFDFIGTEIFAKIPKQANFLHARTYHLGATKKTHRFV